jgi:hypothetical protein
MMSKYRLKAPIRAVYRKAGGGLLSIALPVDAVLSLVPNRPTTVLGTVHVLWKGRHYSIAEKDLQQKADCVP